MLKTLKAKIAYKDMLLKIDNSADSEVLVTVVTFQNLLQMFSSSKIILNYILGIFHLWNETKIIKSLGAYVFEIFYIQN